jgi:hypothetical protein
MKTTKNGLEYKFSDCINEKWMEYYKKVAESHLSNYGVVIVDEFGNPIDNQFDIDQILGENPQLVAGEKGKANKTNALLHLTDADGNVSETFSLSVGEHISLVELRNILRLINGKSVYFKFICDNKEIVKNVEIGAAMIDVVMLH